MKQYVYYIIINIETLIKKKKNHFKKTKKKK
jgi:hypothetical protein